MKKDLLSVGVVLTRAQLQKINGGGAICNNGELVFPKLYFGVDETLCIMGTGCFSYDADGNLLEEVLCEIEVPEFLD